MKVFRLRQHKAKKTIAIMIINKLKHLNADILLCNFKSTFI